MLRLTLLPGIGFILANIYAWKECVFYGLWIQYFVYVSLISCLFISFMSLQIFCQIVLPFTKREVLKSPTVILILSISPLCSVMFCSIYIFEVVLLNAYIFRIFTSFYWICPFIIMKWPLLLVMIFHLMSTLTNINTAKPAFFFWLTYAWYIYFSFSYFQLFLVLIF